jgi:hypothetical protein
MRRFLQPSRRLLAEALEPRHVLSGNVLAAVDDVGRLVITGDNLSNNIVIRNGNSAGEIIVAGGKAGSTAGTQTTVNGSLAPVTISGVTGAIIANMQAGYDRVIVTDLLLQASLQADMGAGNDRLSIQSTASPVADVTLNDGSAVVSNTVRLGVFARLDAGDGQDTVGLTNAVVTGNLDVNGGNGNDRFVQYGADFAGNRVGGRARLVMEDGNDLVSVQRMEVGGDLLVNDSLGTRAEVHLNRAHVGGTARVLTTEGADEITAGTAGDVNGFTATTLIVNSHGGADKINIRDASMFNLTINAGAGDNDVSLTNVVSQDTLRITGGNGLDTVTLDGVITGTLLVRTWRGYDVVNVSAVSATDAFFDLLDGNDTLDLSTSLFGRLRADLGDGDDELTYGSLRVLQTADFDGGAGQDTQTDLGGNTFAQLTVQGFE